MDGNISRGLCKILRIEAEKLGFPSNFTIYDTDDSKSLLKDIVKEQGLDDKIYKPDVVLHRISAAKIICTRGKNIRTMRVL